MDSNLQNLISEVAPKSHYRARLNIDKIAKNNGEFWVCRAIDAPLDTLVTHMPGIKILDASCIPDKILGLSMNLTGYKFQKRHLNIRTKGEGQKMWDGKTIIYPIKDEHAEYSKFIHPLYYSSKKLHNRRFPASVHIQNADQAKSVAKLFRNLAEESFKGKGTETDVETPVVLFIEHVPTNLNYWHVQMEIKPEGAENKDKFTEKTSGTKSKWFKDILLQIKSDVLTMDFVYDPEQVRHELSPCGICLLDTACNNTSIHQWGWVI